MVRTHVWRMAGMGVLMAAAGIGGPGGEWTQAQAEAQAQGQSRTAAQAQAQPKMPAGPAAGMKWVASWASSMQGPYPSGNASAQPVLDFAIESAEQGANDQTFRLIIKPDLWGKVVRLHFSNAFGTRVVTFDDVFVGLQGGAASVVAGTNRPVTFAQGKTQLVLQPGASTWSDPVTLPFVAKADDPLLTGRKLAVSVHVAGTSGPMTWHAKALTTSYMTAPKAGSRGAEVDDAAFPYSTTSWFFLDGLDVMAPADTVVVACFGDSITDGTASTLNGDDRWPDVFARRLHAAYGARVSVVNAGIGGNRIVGPPAYSVAAPFAGGPSALDRLERDVLSLSGLSAIVWLEGINDLSQGATAEAVIAGMQEVVRRVQAHGGNGSRGGGSSAGAGDSSGRGSSGGSGAGSSGPVGSGGSGSVKVVAATITSSVGSNTAHSTPEAEARRQAINTFIRTSGIFAGVADFDAATRDEQTGGLRAAFVPNSTIGGAGDRLHPNRAGYQAMGNAIDLALFAPAGARK